MNDSPDIAGDNAIAKRKAVLVAVDFSEDSSAAVLWASRYARLADARLVILHVVHDPVETPGFYRVDKQDQLLPMQQIAESMMSEFIAALNKRNPGDERLETAETLLVQGLPPGRIVEVADHLNAEIVVIGSRGLTGLSHLMLGSVAERVVEMASRPVVVVKAENCGKKKKKKKKKNKKAKSEK